MNQEKIRAKKKTENQMNCIVSRLAMGVAAFYSKYIGRKIAMRKCLMIDLVTHFLL